MTKRHRKIFQPAIQPTTENCSYACRTRRPEDPRKEQAREFGEQDRRSMSRVVHIQNDVGSHTTQNTVWKRKEEEDVETREYNGPY